MKGVCFLFWTAMAGVVMLTGPSNVSARSEYNRVFWDRYQQELGKYAETTKCNVCHFGNDKKDRNDYGRAFGKALGKEQIRDADQIKAALHSAAKEKSSSAGKTFGELIQAGMLPGKRLE